MNKKIKTKNYPNYTELKLDYSTANIFNPSFIKLFYNTLINLDNSCPMFLILDKPLLIHTFPLYS